MSTTKLSRRDFLKLTGAGLLGTWFAANRFFPAHAIQPASASWGRVAKSVVNLRASASLQTGEIIQKLKRNEIYPLLGTVQGDEPNSPNNFWYLIPNGFVHSAHIQPVEDRPNQPDGNIPTKGMLGEVTVPFVYAQYSPMLISTRAYLHFYETTCWVYALEHNRTDGSDWYRVYNDRVKTDYFIPAYAVRLIQPGEIAPLSSHIPETEKLIRVGLAEQTVIAYENGIPVFRARAATGGRGTETPTGEFRTFYKRGTRHMAGGNAATGYDLPGVPWVTYITDSGVSFHGTYWHNDYGTPQSHGCINLTAQDAKWIYRWTTPVVPPERKFLYLPGEGTRVEISDHLPPNAQEEQP